MKLLSIKFLVLSTFVGLFSASALAGPRYFVVYKSEQGYRSMDQFMKLESGSKPFSMTRSLKNVHAMVIENASAQSLEQLKKHPEVEAVVEEYFLPAPKPVNVVSFSRSAGFVAQTQTVNADYHTFQPAPGTPWGIKAVKATAAWAASDAGSKSRVLVLDSGIDVNHEALQGQIEKVRNFVKPKTGAINPNDVTDESHHGTHVTGTIAAHYNDVTGFVGVAPKVRILMGKVCGEVGCSLIDIATGIDWGITEKVDVITMSLGGPGKISTGNPVQDFIANLALGSMQKPLIKSLAAADAAGIFTVAASGNSATEAVAATPTTPAVPATNPQMGYPAAAATVYAVGAVDEKLVKTSFSQWGPGLDIVGPGADVVSSVPMQTGRASKVNLIVDGQSANVKSTSFAGTKEITIPKTAILVYAGLGKPENFNGLDLTGKFALIKRGEITFADKVKNAQAAHAAGVVFFNNADGLMQGTIAAEGSKDEIDYPVVMIEKAPGEAIVTQLQAGKVASAEVATIKTDYLAFDGTSMATPHVAGVAALAISAYKLSHGGQTIKPAALRQLLSSTAKPMDKTDNKYGAGLIQADAAVNAALQ